MRIDDKSLYKSLNKSLQIIRSITKTHKNYHYAMMLSFQKNVDDQGGRGRVWKFGHKDKGGENGQKFAYVFYGWPFI